MEINEITIPVPWGHIAAKTWGTRTNPPILAVHGGFDNAGSFDLLIPNLPNHYYYVCIDLPGHGKSSHFPKHLLFNFTAYVPVLEVIRRYFHWKTVSLLCHSAGGQIAIGYLEVFPNRVKMLMILDLAYFPPVSNSYFLSRVRKSIDAIVSNEEFDRRKYSYDEAVKKLMRPRLIEGEIITEEAAKALITRGTTEDNGKFYFTLDPQQNRVSKFPGDWSIFIVTNIIAHSNASVLFVFTSKTAQKNFEPAIRELEKHPNCTIKYALSTHSAHLVHPEIVAPLISEFLNIRRSKL